MTTARFRTRARAVDMLGRQQIAGIPTAISELFKNAHDAYARRAVVDYFRSDGLVVIRDDGVGMTRREFEERWLTLGTESKVMSAGVTPAPLRSGMPMRAVLGEKGIGRLAIAAIGPQVLVMTRPERDGRLGDLTVAFLHWGFFEIPGVDLEEIEIPILELPGGELPSRRDVAGLLRQARSGLEDLAPRTPPPLLSRMSRELEAYGSVAPDALAPHIGEPDLVRASGTHFLVVPSSPLLADDVARADSNETELLRTLMGFANTMTPGHPPPVMRTSFRDHYAEDAWSDMIDVLDFFSPEEFEAADHRIVGGFDEFGAFTGSIGIYGADPVPYALPWTKARGVRTDCGAFRFDLAYIMGLQRQSRLPPDDFKAISDKLERYAGLYIYRDGIRVLPYGSVDLDRLEIERRRTISASDYFFSHRRMFGAVAITKAVNGALTEKAGREGFATNKAYRQFREILKAFLYQVAVDFFREDPAQTDLYRTQRGELERLDEARRRREKQARERRRAFQQDLDRFFDGVGGEIPAKRAAEILEELRASQEAALLWDEPDRVAEALVAGEIAGRRALRDLADEYEVRRPRGIGLSQAQSRLMRAYDGRRAQLVADVLEPTAAEIERLLAEVGRVHGASIGRRVRFDRALEAAVDEGRASVAAGSRELRRAAEDATQRSGELARTSVRAVEEAAREALRIAARLDLSRLTDQDLVSKRTELEGSVATATEERSRALASVTEQLRALAWPTNGSSPLVTQLDVIEAIETELEARREDSERDLQLTQLGMAIEVVNHEFQLTVRGMRRSLNRLKAWADRNESLREPYQELRRNFEHLDGYLKLFTPLDRRLHRSRIEISGYDIERFLQNLFGERMTREGIGLVATQRFLEHRIKAYPSTVYPVFVNLLDNALYWLADYPGSRQVELDQDAGDLIVTDSGPGVSERDREAVFELGFSRKPAGSGYGLHISREVLRREGLDLLLAQASSAHGARFVIRSRDEPPSDVDREDG